MAVVPSRHGFLQSFLMLAFTAFSFAQGQSHPQSRITQPVDDQVRVTLKGNVHPLAQAQFDRGAVPDSFPAQRVFVVLQRSPERESALQQFLQDVHRKGSASYHKWLTPQKFGELYGPDDSEISAVTKWLQGHGLEVSRVTKGKTSIEFSGTAAQLRGAFHTEIHTFVVNGETHHANSVDPQIPSALAPVISGLSPLNDFHPASYMKVLGKGTYDASTHLVTPEWTFFGTPPVLGLTPGDLAVQYDLNPLYNKGTDGTGVTIGIIGASDIDPTAVVNYHAIFGLPPLNFTSVIDGSDTNPNQGNWASGESYLDVEVASALAPGAMINLYTAADTSLQSGLLLAAVRAVDDDQASVLSTSYGQCEFTLGPSGNQFWATLWEQAAAQGQTSFVSSGDGGSAGCDNFDIPQPAQLGLAVSGFTSTPWNISVGGTDFYYNTYNGTASDQQTQLANYWNLTPTATPAVSMLQPIPEQPWNRAFGLNLYDGGVYSPGTYGAWIVGGGGGASVVYSKPAWQSGTGVPTDKARDIPDVSLFAADGENDSFWIMCAGSDGCSQPVSGVYEISAVGGTSASTPAMAAIMALVNQKYGPQGQANYILYPLAVQQPGAFHDVAIGSNNVPCQPGTLNCSVSSQNDNTNGFNTLGHYSSNAGYDEATGLGSVDANLLVQNWNSLTFTPSTTTLTPSQTTFQHGAPITLTIAVSGNGGTPSGDVGLVTTASAASNTSVGELTLTAGAASETINTLPGGQYDLTAKYTGDTKFAPSNSTPIQLNVTPENSTVSVYGTAWSNGANAFVPITNGGTYPYGTYFALNAQPQSQQGTSDGLATGAVAFTDSVGGSTVSSGPVNISRLGVAEWIPPNSLPPGANSLTVSYPGDASYHASSSGPFVLNITKVDPSASLGGTSPIAVGSMTTLTSTVGALYDSPLPPPPYSTYPYSSPLSPTGTITFSFGNTVLGTVGLSANYNGLYESSAVLNVMSLPLGTDTITASYSGDNNYKAASSTFNVVVEQAPTLMAVANPSSINWGEFTAITATVAGVNGMPVPTGTIDFFAAGVGSDFTDTETLKNGSATSLPLPGGLFFSSPATVSVTYNGDSVYGPLSVDASFDVTQANLPPFSLSSTSLTIAAGATANNTSTITVSPENNFTGSVYFSCSLTSSPAGAIHLPTCNVTPSLNVTGATAETATMTISSTAPSTSRAAAARTARYWLGVNGGLAFAGLVLVGAFPRRRKMLRLTALMLLLGLLVALPGCGGGSSPGGGGRQQIPGTTAGNYTFTVGAALSSGGVAQAQTSVTVTVQ